MRSMYSVLLLSVLCASSVVGEPVTALIPLKHAYAGEIHRMLSGVPAMRPEGIEKLWDLPEHDALVARGEPRAIDQLREILCLLDQPTKVVSVHVRVVLVPAGLEGADAEWWSDIEGAAAGGDGPRRLERGDFSKRLEEIGQVGGTVITPILGSPVKVVNNRRKTVWLPECWAGLAAPNYLPAGVVVTPRINADSTITIYVCGLRALPDEAQGARIEVGGLLEVKVTTCDGESVLLGPWYPGLTHGEAEEGQSLLMLTARILPEAELTRTPRIPLDVE